MKRGRKKEKWSQIIARKKQIKLGGRWIFFNLHTICGFAEDTTNELELTIKMFKSVLELFSSPLLTHLFPSMNDECWICQWQKIASFSFPNSGWQVPVITPIFRGQKAPQYSYYQLWYFTKHTSGFFTLALCDTAGLSLLTVLQLSISKRERWKVKK